MLDENLPTFRFRPSSESPLSHVLYYTQNGSEPKPEYMLRRPDPARARGKYAAALCDPYNPDVIYGEVLIEAEWTQPSLSAAEIRAQQQHYAGPAAQSPSVPDEFKVLLYNPDSSVVVKMAPGGWNKTDAWEFEMPIHSFVLPSVSELDREQWKDANAASDFSPRVMFRWKKDSKLGKDMTCYMTGKRLGGRKSKEPDITLALFKAARESAVTVYEPNLQRLDLEDRKGLEVVILLAAEVVRELWLMPRHDVFNVSGPSATANAGKRKDSGPTPAAMSGAIPVASSAYAAAASTIDAETRRLRAMVEQEERVRRRREAEERDAETRRLRAMVDQEERVRRRSEAEERRRREAEVARETARLRSLYGVEGQDLPSSSLQTSMDTPLAAPALPPRPRPHMASSSGPHPQLQPQQQIHPNMPMPPRPFSAGPGPSSLPQLFGPTSFWNVPSVLQPFGPNSGGNNGRIVNKKRSVQW